MRSMCRVLFKKKRLQCTTKTVNLHVRLTQIVLEQDPCRWSSDTEGATAVYVSSWNRGTTSRWRLAERRCCRSATWILWTRPAFSSQLHICQVSCLHLLYCNASVLTTSIFLLAQRNTQAKTPAKIFTITYMVVYTTRQWLIDWLIDWCPQNHFGGFVSGLCLADAIDVLMLVGAKN